MSNAHRLADICTGHGCFPSRPNNQASTNTFVNGKGQHRKTDSWTQHCCPNNGCHTSVLAEGSPTHFTNGLESARIGDPVACGSYALTGSMDTYIGPTAVSGPGSPGWGPDPVYFKYFRASDARAGDLLLEIASDPFD